MAKDRGRRDGQREQEPAPRVDTGLRSLRRILDGLAGARLCFGEPVRAGDVTVIPVARVRAAGGAGFGRGDAGAVDGPTDPGGGGGGGGYVEADPVGFVTVAADGSTRYDEIPDPQAHARQARTIASAVATLLTALAGARALRRAGGAARGARVTGLLRRGD